MSFLSISVPEKFSWFIRHVSDGLYIFYSNLWNLSSDIWAQPLEMSDVSDDFHEHCPLHVGWCLVYPLRSFVQKIVNGQPMDNSWGCPLVVSCHIGIWNKVGSLRALIQRTPNGQPMDAISSPPVIFFPIHYSSVYSIHYCVTAPVTRIVASQYLSSRQGCQKLADHRLYDTAWISICRHLLIAYLWHIMKKGRTMHPVMSIACWFFVAYHQIFVHLWETTMQGPYN